jgi:lactoylglutathione lyase
MGTAMDGVKEAETTPVRLGFVKLVVRNLPAMTAFYSQALGLRALRTIENATMAETVLAWPGGGGSDARLVLYRHSDGRELSIGTAHGPIGLFVPDVDASFARAVAHGASAHIAPCDVAAGRVAFVHDPEGHEIEFVSLRGS